MIIIGEKLNSSLKDVKAAIENADVQFIQELAKRQYEAGAAYIDINAGVFGKSEAEKLEWMIDSIQREVEVPFSIDSQNPKALEAALKQNKNRKPIINSITDEKEKFSVVLPLVHKYETSVIALCMDDEGMPETIDERMVIARRLVEKLVKEGLKLEDIFVDPLVRPISTGSQHGRDAIETIRRIKLEFPQVHIACGLSNISFGLPARKLMNQVFLVAAMSAGMDGTIMNPLDGRLMALMHAANTLLGNDRYCMEYSLKYREGLLDA